MQVFKAFMKILLHNRGMVLMYFIIFAILTVAFSNIGQDMQQEVYADSEVNLAMIDRDKSEVSTAITGLLAERHNLVELADDQEAMQDALYNRDVSYILFIPAGYGTDFAAGKQPTLESAEVAGSYDSTYVERLIDSYVATTETYMESGMNVTDALGQAGEDVSIHAEAEVTSTVDLVTLAPMFYYFKYMAYGMMLMMIFGLCPVLMTFGEKPIAMRMNSSALSLRQRNMGLGMGAAVLAAMCYAVMMLLGFIMFGKEMLTAVSGICMLNALCFLVFSAALALFIGQLATSTNMVNAIANAMGLGLCFLGGIFVPMEFMGESMLEVAKFMPTYWYVTVAETAIGNGALSSAALGTIWQSMGIQLLFAGAFIAAALVVSRKKRRVE